MTGSTRLEDLSRGPPDNYGMNDSDLLDNIVNEVQNINSSYSKSNELDTYYSEDDQDNYYPEHYYNDSNPNLARPTPSQRTSQYNNKVHGVSSIPRKPKSRPADVYSQFANKVTQDTSEIITEILVVSGLIYLSQMNNVIKLLNNFLPSMLKILDPVTNLETFNGKIIKPVILSFLFWLFRKYFKI